jgi:hypothetical protein
VPYLLQKTVFKVTLAVLSLGGQCNCRRGGHATGDCPCPAPKLPPFHY